MPDEPKKTTDMTDDEKEAAGLEPCKTCDGTGWVEDPSDGGTMTCPECDGDEWI